jgi:hypothetical protein
MGGYETSIDTDRFLHGAEESVHEDEEREQSPTHLSPPESGFSDMVRGYGSMACKYLERQGLALEASERRGMAPSGSRLTKGKGMALADPISPPTSRPRGVKARRKKQRNASEVGLADEEPQTRIMAEATMPSPHPSRAKRVYVKRPLAADVGSRKGAEHRQHRSRRQVGGPTAQSTPSPMPVVANPNNFTPPRTRTRPMWGGSPRLKPVCLHFGDFPTTEGIYNPDGSFVVGDSSSATRSEVQRDFAADTLAAVTSFADTFRLESSEGSPSLQEGDNEGPEPTALPRSSTEGAAPAGMCDMPYTSLATLPHGSQRLGREGMNGQPTETRSDVATTLDSDEEPPTPTGKRFVGQAVAVRLMSLV